MMEFFEILILVLLFRSFLVKLQDVDHGLWIFSPLAFRNPALVDQSLPFFRQALALVNNRVL